MNEHDTRPITGDEGMTLRTKNEQKAYLDGFEMCADCIEKYLSNEGKQKLECFLMAVRNAVEIEDIEPQESEDLGDYPDTIHNQFDNMTGSMNL